MTHTIPGWTAGTYYTVFDIGFVNTQFTTRQQLVTNVFRLLKPRFDPAHFKCHATKDFVTEVQAYHVASHKDVSTSKYGHRPTAHSTAE